MRRVQTDPLSAAAGFAGASEDAALPVPVETHAASVPTGAPHTAATVGRSALRAVRYAAVAVALMLTVPIGLVALRGPAIVRMGSFSEYVHGSVLKNEAWRALALPSDPSITPAQAGSAYAAIQPAKSGQGFVAAQPENPPAMSWRDAPLTPDMFLTAPPGNSKLPSTKGILQAASQGLSPNEMAYLRTLAAAPAWREFDIVARAPAVDFLGGQFRVPFGPEAYVEFRLQDFAAVRQMAAAAVSRAAYHMAIGQRDSAVVILRTIVSFGFALSDNGTSTMEEMMGSQVIDIGRVALRQYYEIQHDPRAATLANLPRGKGQPDAFIEVAQFRAAQLAKLGDPARHRGERFESLNLLAKSSCTNVPELMTGPRGDITAAIDNARRSLARYPSERALIDQMEANIAPKVPEGYSNPISDLAVSAATVAGVALHNPRLAACTRILTLW
ncbi:MAG: hypothetical protein M3Z05_01775 [Gemmatimonadota bacterium]|nr:hypothetical protein [Gemmatimonadota bacterium]